MKRVLSERHSSTNKTMVIEIQKDLFEGSDFKGLNYLIQILTYEQRYAVFVDYPVIENIDFYNKLDEEDKELIIESFNNIVDNSYFATYSVSVRSADSQFNLEEAIRFFIQPVSIILENSLNDQYFVTAIIKHFDSSGEVMRHLENGWIQFENAGSCSNVENFINGKLESFSNLANKHGSQKHKYLRCFVLLDSDKVYPSMSYKPAYVKLITFLASNCISSHILAKREMENYMPDAVFDKIATNQNLKKWFDAYQYLSDEQKDYFDIENGFPKMVRTHLTKREKQHQNQKRGQKGQTQSHTQRRKRSELDANIKTLYHNVSDANFEILDKGFKYPDFKTKFPKYFEEPRPLLIHKKSLSERAGSNELQEIVDKITLLL